MADLDFWQSILEYCSDSESTIPLEQDVRSSDLFDIPPLSGDFCTVDKEHGVEWDISNWSVELESSIPAISLPMEVADTNPVFPSTNLADVSLSKNPIESSASMCAVDERDKEIKGQKNDTYHQRGSSSMSRITDITMNELSHYFNMPIAQAAKELNVGLTVLKKKCRGFGIPRWPHRKMKSLECLIHNIQEQKRLMEEMPGIEIPERTKCLRQACFKASYKKRRRMAIEAPKPDPLTL
ncbi:protein RKD4-like [Cryptomeria japonica]|uniref:protein RKD4-like n=1 Tax=Cryptomeria japonica TaxID=3369 RepID=UPI0027D9E380|nr:protein RKD4-like [Cryptomeria japonica]